MIFDSDAIQFKYSHVRGAKKQLNFNIKSGEFGRILDKFKSDIEVLREKTLPEEHSFLMFCKALGLTFDLNNENEFKGAKEKERLETYRNNFNSKLDKYTKELSNNYYALYNVITDVGTKGFENEKLFVTKVNSRQSRAGSWLNQITGMLREGNINYNEYLMDYLDLLKN